MKHLAQIFFIGISTMGHGGIEEYYELETVPLPVELAKVANATQVEDGNPRNRFLDIFGRPRRTSACTCDRTGDPTLSQALHLINGQTIAKRISNKEGRLQTLLRSKTNSKEILDEIYLAAYGRHPTDKERKHLLSVVDADPKARQQAFEDTFWAMLNSKEFIFNH